MCLVRFYKFWQELVRFSWVFVRCVRFGRVLVCFDKVWLCSIRFIKVVRVSIKFDKVWLRLLGW